MAFTTKEQKQTSFQKKNAPAANLEMGLTDEAAEAIEQSLKIQEAEKAAVADAIPEAKKKFILKEIHVDSKTILRKRVELTPSMCTSRGCGFDAAVHCGYHAGWGAVPHNQRLPDGRTLGEAVLGVLQSHADTQHGFDDSHIMTEDQVNSQKQWSGVSPHFLTNNARS